MERIKRLIISIFFGAIAIAIVVFLASTNWKIYQKRISLESQAAVLKKQIGDLEQKNTELNKNLSYAKSDEYAEKVARDQLDLKKPGEGVVVVEKEPSQNNKEEQNPSWWEKLKSIFIK